MGLLDDLLGGLAGPGGHAPAPTTRAGAGGTSATSTVIMALLPVVLAMLSNRGGQPGSRGQMSSGGPGDILGQVLGGAGGGRAGGLGDVLAQMQRAGFGEQAASWVGTGANRPIPPDAMSQIFGREGLEQISRQAGLSEEDASRGLSELLPEVVDRVTPGGDLPDLDALTSTVADLARRFGIR